MPLQEGCKKAAKKTAKHHPGHRQASDLRRAYEHMSRVEILQRSLKPQMQGGNNPGDAGA